MGLNAEQWRAAKAVFDQINAEQVNTGPEPPPVGGPEDFGSANGQGEQRKPAPFEWLDYATWANEPTPKYEWSVHDRFPLRQTVLLSGQGGAGKSLLLLHLTLAHVLGREWLNTWPEPGPAFFIDAEDDESVMHIRLKGILEYYDATIADAVKGGLQLKSLVGQDAVLATATRGGRIEPTPLYHQLLQEAGDIKPRMIGIASSADVFAGEERDRSQVKQFVSLLTRMAIAANGTTALIAHPSLEGIKSGSGLSGSTQWHNSVRARAVMSSIKGEDGEAVDSDLRQVEFLKNQYGRLGARIVVRYKDGLFLPVPGMSSPDRAAAEEVADAVFLETLRRLTKESRYVSAKGGHNYAPTMFAKEPEAKAVGLRKEQLADAMRRLFKNGKNHNEQYGRSDRPSFRIVEGAP
jgi:RecA-family ATPase